jgi:hypothetical protein
LKSEIENITATLEDQQRVLVALDDSINAGEARSVILESYAKHGREASTIEFSLECTEETLANFVEMERRRGELESWVSTFIQNLFVRFLTNISTSTSEPSKQPKTVKRRPLSHSPLSLSFSYHLPCWHPYLE